MFPSFASWSVLTTDFLIVLYLMLGGAVFSAVLQVCGARWHYEFRRVALSLFALYPLALVLLSVLLSAPEITFPWFNFRRLCVRVEHLYLSVSRQVR